MLTSKQRAKLRAMANGLDTILQVGKAGVGEQLIKQVNDALTARELIKIRALETSPESARETAERLAEEVNAEVVQVMGSRITLYRRNPKKPVIELN